jgi:hypothetical protein
MNPQSSAVGLISTGDEKRVINPTPSVPRISARRLQALQDVREADDLAVANARHRADRMFIERVKLGWVPQTEADWMNVGVAALVIRQPSDRIRYVESNDPDAGPVEVEASFRGRIGAIERRIQNAQKRVEQAQAAVNQIQREQEALEHDPRPTYDQALACYDVWRERLREAGLDDLIEDGVLFAWERSPVETRGPQPFHPDEAPERIRPEITLDQVAETISAVTRAQERLLDEIADAPWVAFRLGLGPDPSIWTPESTKTRHGHYSGGESLTLVSIRKRRESARNSNGRIPIEPEWAEPHGQTLMLEWVLAHLGERPSRAYTLHRKVNALGYVRGNIEWATKRTQRLEQDRVEAAAKGSTRESY